jgi:hypothetical protein
MPFKLVRKKLRIGILLKKEINCLIKKYWVEFNNI